MTQKELGELRRHFRPDRVNVRTIYGCYVNTKKEIVSYIDGSMALLPREERETYLGFLKKSLSGALGRNLVDIEFSTRQVQDSPEHSLLMRLRKDRLTNAEDREALYQKIIASVDMEDANYVILLAADAYDVPKKGRDGAEQDSEVVFEYILCAVCPTREIKPELQFYPGDNEFHATVPGQVIAPTELGFLFPAFDDRTANIYKALFYTRNTADSHADFISGVFNTELALSAGEQREVFERALTEELGDEYDFAVMQSVNERFSTLIREHKEEKIPEPLAVGSGVVGEMLTDCGVSDKAVKAFADRCREELGEGASIRPENVIDTKRFTIRTEEVTVAIAPEQSFRLETRIIDGRKCLVIPVGSSVEINGVETKV